MKVRRWGKINAQSKKVEQIIEDDAVSQADTAAFQWKIIGDDVGMGDIVTEVEATKAKAKSKAEAKAE